MGKRPRTDDEINQDIDKNINKIKKIILDKKEIYDKFVSDTSTHNLVIEKVKEKLNEELKEKDVLHFKGILRTRYSDSIRLLHECSDNIKKLEIEHYKTVDKIAIDKQKLKK
jgi:hypothetical protein